jgi:ubiquinol-cytochrome c reductase cytochrome b/c1 subunit
MAHSSSSYEPSTGIEKWIDQRLPIPRLMHDQFMAFPTPRNLNYWWTFGGILTFMLVSHDRDRRGACHALRGDAGARLRQHRASHARRELGWLLRYTHAVGASMFFLAAYIHTLRGLYYGSYKAPRELIWILGVLILFMMIATAFMGYSLVWGQMSFWAVTVITNLFSSLDAVVPGIGTRLVEWIWGGFAVGGPDADAALQPALSIPVPDRRRRGAAYLGAAHPGNNNPSGIDVKSPRETIPFHPYYTIKDGFALALFALFFACFVFYAPNLLGHPDNYIPANPLQTPAHIVPEWYFLPFYAILRAVPSKLFGVAALISSIATLFFVPWLDTSRVRSTSYRPIYKWFFWAFVLTCIALGYLGSQPPEGIYLVLGAHPYRLLFPVLPPGHAGGWVDREAEGTPRKHHRIGARAAGDAGRRAKARASPPCSGASGMTKPSPIGLALIAGSVIAFAGALKVAVAEDAKQAAEPVNHEAQFESQKWSFTGPFGYFDNAQLQRGYHVYKQICSNCHSMRLLSYRNLGELGGPEFSPEAVETLASEVQVTDGPNDKGEMFQRPGRPSDRFRSPFPNDAAARAANGGALPPDLSVMAKARPGGPDYIYALLTGYRQTPAGFDLAPGMHYNVAFPGHQIAMPPPLFDGAVPYTDGTKPTVGNYARDVSAFLMWAAEPKLEERHQLGARVVIFLVAFAVIMFLAKRTVWARLHPKAAHTA